MWDNVIPRTIPRGRGLFVCTTAERKQAGSGDENGSHVAEICRSRGGSSFKTVWKAKKTWVNKGCAYNVVLGETGPAYGVVNRAAMGRARFMFYPWFFSFCVERPKLPLGHIVSWTSNRATYDVYSLKVVETLIHGQCYGYCQFLYCA